MRTQRLERDCLAEGLGGQSAWDRELIEQGCMDRLYSSCHFFIGDFGPVRDFSQPKFRDFPWLGMGPALSYLDLKA